MPFPLTHSGIDVQYVDRWEPEANAELFPELGSEATFPKPDIIANLDTDRLQALADASTDFAVASHLLEHLADPIGLMGDIFRVLRPGGVLLILLPDRHLTFDRLRPPTSIEHLIAEHDAGVTEVDDVHIEEFVRATAPIDTPQSLYLSDDSDERQRQIQVHRHRSIHAHCWDQDEFEPIIRYCIDRLEQRWEFVDALLTEEGGPDSIEFGFVIRKSIAMLPPSVLADRFQDAWLAWREDHRQVMAMKRQSVDQLNENRRIRVRLVEAEGQVKDLEQWLGGLRGELYVVRGELSAVQGKLTSLRNTKTFRYTELPRRAYARLIH